jgi:uncharacterized protein YprB with RNaseH-like and TPR domain
MRLLRRLRRDLATSAPDAPTAQKAPTVPETRPREPQQLDPSRTAPAWRDHLSSGARAAGGDDADKGHHDEQPTALLDQLRRGIAGIDRRYRLLSRRARHEQERQRPQLGTEDSYVVPEPTAVSHARELDLASQARRAPRRRLAARSFHEALERVAPKPPPAATPTLPWNPRDASACGPLRQPHSPCGLLYRQRHSPGQQLGALDLTAPTPDDLQLISRLLRRDEATAAPERLDARELLFLDTETTGLSRGAGTIAFMIGVGFFDDEGGLVIDQIVLDSPEREAEGLALLAGYLERRRVLVTFNGASFDLPVLRNRALLTRTAGLEGLDSHGLDSHGPDRHVHIDLLPLSRRLFRQRLPDCKLGTIERHVLGFARTDDIPGAEVPLAYLRFLRHGAREELQQVLEHNLLDIASLAVLLPRVCRHLFDPLRWAEDAAELLASGRYWAASDPELASACLERAVELATRPAERRHARSELARLCRRRGEREHAREQWEALRREFPQDDEPYIELAKHHEHVTKDLSSALRHAEAAPHAERPQIQHRLARLRRRLERAQNDQGRSALGVAAQDPTPGNTLDPRHA